MRCTTIDLAIAIAIAIATAISVNLSRRKLIQCNQYVRDATFQIQGIKVYSVHATIFFWCAQYFESNNSPTANNALMPRVPVFLVSISLK